MLDVNSASPRTKTACAAVVAEAGGRYVEAAVMSSVPPHGIRVPMLLGGPHAHSAAADACEARLRRERGLDLVWRRIRDQAVPQRDHQGHGGARHREPACGAALWRRARSACVARRDVSRPRLGAAGDLVLAPRRPARAPPRRGNARGRRDGRRRGCCASHGEQPPPTSKAGLQRFAPTAFSRTLPPMRVGANLPIGSSANRTPVNGNDSLVTGH